ncbi:hypothetical protein EK21DRAFT_65652 [Setomelanomma holmii]|uniref:Uncharacterized protein n=1 Tax=Setomelanomma holmii TaxID=210430 RepID=A0A9P4LKE8_9PLEO|nr:hypothetical protein EK21DRAFT_65652 [Setomelanomma holmii]
MAPLRRYLRITKHSVLEVRIYLDRPADADAWLLKRGDPALPRVIKAVRPLVLPKLREENERGRGKGGAKAKRKGVKDVVVEGYVRFICLTQTANDFLDDFEVSIFLTELSSRHSVLTKQKIFKDKARIRSNSAKLTNWLTTGTSDQPVVVNDDTTDVIVLREEEDEDAIKLADVPEADPPDDAQNDLTRNKRRKRGAGGDSTGDDSDSDESALFVPGHPAKRSKVIEETIDSRENEEELQDDKKKLELNTSYDGFSIYSRILCLVVKRRGLRAADNAGPASSQQMLESWVSTQAAAEQIDDDEDAG